MKRSMINEVRLGEVKLSGWVHRIKKLKSVVFVILRDRTGLLQLAVSPEQVDNLRLETVITVTGTAVERVNKYSLIEVQVEVMKILSEVKEDLPVTINQEALAVSLETLLNNRVLTLRHEKEQAIFKIKSEIAFAFSMFLRSNGFTEIHSPKLVKEGAEGGADVFELDYFDKKAYLAQSPQFYKQMMVIAGMERVFEVAPVFRAESHSTIRHLNEYTSMDLEMGFIESEEELIRLETELLRYMMTHLNQKCKQALITLNEKLPIVPENIPVLRLDRAIEILKTNYNKNLEGDLDPEGELLIHDYIYQTTGSEFVYLTHYPKTKRPMYTMPDGQATRSFDLLFRGLEITTGGLRIHDKDMLLKSMAEKGLESSDYESYLESFNYGVPPHGGLAIGLERLTAKLLNIDNIRRTTLFPRDKIRLTP